MASSKQPSPQEGPGVGLSSDVVHLLENGDIVHLLLGRIGVSLPRSRISKIFKQGCKVHKIYQASLQLTETIA